MPQLPLFQFITLAFCWSAILPMLPSAEKPLHFEHWGIEDPVPEFAPSFAQSKHANPATFPHSETFAERREQVIRALAQEDFVRWRSGYFKGGDPGKYLPGAAMAKLLVNPDDEMVVRYMNDKRSPKEHYHFAAVNWARYIPFFRSTINEATWQTYLTKGATQTSYINGGGTENHKTMQYTGPLVLPWYTDSGLGNLSRDETLAAGKQWIKDYVKNIYRVGMGEWESSTYHAFTINAFLNVYDFSQDPEVRLLAQAALDYYVASFALKYRDGILSGPSQRGFSKLSTRAITDTLGWMWWGTTRQLGHNQVKNYRYTSHTWSSQWRPNRILTNLATKQLPKLNEEWRNSKSNYWFGQRIEPKSSAFHESYFIGNAYNLGSLWSGWDYHGQTVRWQLTADGSSQSDGAITLTGGHPIQLRSFDGLGKYDRTAQADSTLVLITDIPDDDPHHFSFVHIPEHATWPEQKDGWWVMRARNTWIGIKGIASEGRIDLLPRNKKDTKRKRHPHSVLRFDGQRAGFVLIASDTTNHSQEKDFLQALNKTQLEINIHNKVPSVQLQTLQGQSLAARLEPGKRYLETSINGEDVHFNPWPVYQGKYLSLDQGVLRINDGVNGYQVDFSGDLPVYSDWTPKPSNETP